MGCLFVCLYRRNVKKVKPFGPNFIYANSRDPREGLLVKHVEPEKMSTFIILENTRIQIEKYAKFWVLQLQRIIVDLSNNNLN